MEFRILGALEVVEDGKPVHLQRRLTRALLAYLLLHANHPVPADVLVEELWAPRAPRTVRASLQNYVSRLRAALGPGYLSREETGYVLRVDPECLDLARFERLVAEARESPAPERAELLREALALWRGPALADLTYEPFAQVDIHRLEQLRWEALELRIDCDLEVGCSDLVAELEALVAAEPLRERLREQLMLALYRQGRQAEALAAYRNARSTLMDELGIEPNPDLRALEAAILRQDPALALPVRAPAPAQRKLVTVLFADLADSTGLAVSLDPESWRTVQRRYFEAASAAVARHGGTTEKFVGDAVMAVFGTPTAHEDDALRAARAAVEARDAVSGLGRTLERELGVRLAVRVGLATGEVVSGGAAGDPLATGPAVNLAARLQQEVAPGEIAVDELTRRLTSGAGRFRKLGELDLRGLRRPVHAFRLDALVPGAAAVSRRLDAPLVGRGRELAALRDALATAVAERVIRAVTISGPAGIGKSRLARELLGAIEDEATVLRGRCLSYGESATFRPLRDALGSAEAVVATLEGEPDAAAVAARLEAVFGSDTTVPADEVPWAFRRYCETLASRRPLVLALDDLHWAEPALLDLVEHLATSAGKAPILLVCLTREELDEERPDFPKGAARLALEPLSDTETDELADHLLPQFGLDDETRDRLVAAAEGNPLFLEQLVAHVAETGLLEPPPTLRALLAARLDRLGPGERGVLERAAVVGREFAPSDVAELVDAAAVPTVRAHLDVLVRRGFLRPGRDTRFRFRHGLLHDSVYRAAPKALRAELHERFADVLERAQADDEDVGYHLERAYLLRAELGPPDRHARRLAEDAGRRLGAAGIRSWKHGEAGGASRLLERATALLPKEDEERRELLCELGIAFHTAGDPRRADDVLLEAEETAARSGDRRIELRAQIELAALRLLGDPHGSAGPLLELAEAAVPVFESLGDDRALGRTWMLSGWVHGGIYCRNAIWERSAEHALLHYRRAGSPPATCIGHIAAALYFGPTPASAAVARCSKLLEDEVDDLAREASVAAYLGGLHAMAARFDVAWSLLDRARGIYLDLGRPGAVARTCAQIEAATARLAGEPERAIAILDESCRTHRSMENWSHLGTQAAELADALAVVGRDGEAEEWLYLAESHSPPDDVSAQLSWRPVRARLLARAGEVDRAEAVAREAVAIAEATDALNQRASALLALAECLVATGERAEASEAVDRALRLYDLKENAAAAARLRSETAATASS